MKDIELFVDVMEQDKSGYPVWKTRIIRIDKNAAVTIMNAAQKVGIGDIVATLNKMRDDIGNTEETDALIDNILHLLEEINEEV